MSSKVQAWRTPVRLPSAAYRTSLWKVTQTWGWASARSKDRKSRSTAQVQEHACLIMALFTGQEFGAQAPAMKRTANLASIAGQARRCSISIREPIALLRHESHADQRGAATGSGKKPTSSSARPEAHAAPGNWPSAERRCARLKWRAASFQDAIEAKCEGMSSMLEVK